MTINRPRIAGKPAVERRNVVDQTFQPIGVPPTEDGGKVVDGQFVQTSPVAIEREGQLSFVLSLDDSGYNRSCTIYVAVNIGGTLTWKQAAPVPSIIGQYTGKPFDPIYD